MHWTWRKFNSHVTNNYTTIGYNIIDDIWEPANSMEITLVVCIIEIAIEYHAPAYISLLLFLCSLKTDVPLRTLKSSMSHRKS